MPSRMPDQNKKFYIASAAQAAYESLRSLSRTGVRPDDETIRKMNENYRPDPKQKPDEVKDDEKKYKKDGET